MTQIPLVDLRMGDTEVAEVIPQLEVVLRRGWFVLGPEVAAFEEELARASERRHAIGVGSGTDALILALRALGVGPTDEVIVPDFTAFPTVAAVMEVGASPVLVDVEEARPLLALEAVLGAVTPRTKAVILVHLYGVCGDSLAFAQALRPLDVALIEDCAQAQGATLPSGSPVGTVGVAATFSFYPTKNLGAVGDGGAVVTDDENIAHEVRALRSHGERAERYRHEIAARNSRLDDVQAVVLRYRLARLEKNVTRRRNLSEIYAKSLPPSCHYVAHGAGDAPHLAVIRTKDRRGLSAHLRALGIGTGIHYPYPVSQQPALGDASVNRTPNASGWAAECLSLPMYPELTDESVGRVALAVAEWAD